MRLLELMVSVLHSMAKMLVFWLKADICPPLSSSYCCGTWPGSNRNVRYTTVLLNRHVN